MKRLLVLTAFGLALIRPCHADVAIVVGADYANRAHLEGPQNDAADMKAALEALHFQVPYYLPGFQATYAAITDALKAVKSKIGKKERFVFYFAGHGLPKPASIVPCDYPDTRKLIEMKDLYDLVYDIRKSCASATVILDSCFSGGMAKEATIASKQFGTVRTRCYPIDDLPGPGSKSGILARYKDPQQQVAPDYSAPVNKPICYVMAASANQKANECQFTDGKAHGIFTVYLKNELAKSSSLDIDWDQVQRSVQSQMDGQFERIEQATNENFIQDVSVTNEYKPDKPFDPLALNQKNVVPGTALQMIEQDKIDPATLSIEVPGDRRDYLLGEPVKLSVKIGKPGYLVVLSQLSAVTLYFPQSRQVDDAKVSPGDFPLFTAGKQYGIFNEDGDQEVRAILFADKESAARFLAAMPAPGAKKAALDAVKLSQGATAPEYWTSSAEFQAHSMLFGGYEIVDAKSLVASLRQDDYGDLLSYMATANLIDFDALSHWITQADGFGPARTALTTALNFAIEGSGRWTDKSWAAKCPDPLKSKLAAGQALTEDEGGLLLASLFPQSIRAIQKPTGGG